MKFNALVVDSDIQSRMRLKGAASSVSSFKSVQLLNDLKQAQNILTCGDESIDVIFLSSRCDRSDIRAFIAEAKKSQIGQDAAYVLLLGTSEQAHANLATNVLDGFDGFLIEPYSVDGLMEITHLASRVKGERSLVREKVAIKLLVREIIGQIDVIAQLKSGGAGASISINSLRETCSVLQKLEQHAHAIFHESAIEQLIDAPVPQIKNTRIYAGVSKRIKQKQEVRLIAQAKKSVHEEEKVAIGSAR
jgi:hypothetical protein